jgi:N-6 DNA Methylase
MPGGKRRGGSSASGQVHVEVTPPAEQRFPSPSARSPHVPSGAAAPSGIVDNAARLCDMNLLLHGIGGPDAPSPVTVDDAIRSDPGDRFDLVLTNGPFGKKSSVTVANAEG